MKKTMYSLMLAEDVIAAIDRLAEEKGTNRSNLVNQILAEYLSMTTPEKHVQNIFDIIERIIGKQQRLSALLAAARHDHVYQELAALPLPPHHPLRGGDVPHAPTRRSAS